MHAVFNNAVFLNVALAVQWATDTDLALISPTTRLVDDLALGRFGRLRLAICLEEVFDDELSDDVLNRFVTVGDIATYFGRHVSAIPNPQFRASVAA